MSQMRYRRDPAPSVLRYRLGRLWLTPSFRRTVLFGPLLAVGLGGTLFLATNDTVTSWAAQTSENLRESIVGRDEFRVSRMEVFGASEGLRAKITGMAGLTFPMSSLDMDLVGLREKFEALPRVASAAVRLGSGGVLEVNVTERMPNVVWRHATGLALYSADGVHLGDVASRLDRADLPLIAGQGATDHIGEAMELFSIASGIKDRVRGLQRVGARRWTLVLDQGREIWLPETGARTALMRVMATHATQEILDKDVTIVDLRVPDRPVLRLGQVAVSELRPVWSENGEAEQ